MKYQFSTKRLLLSLLLGASCMLQAPAQSLGLNMTDQKILEYITQASEEGKSQQEIAKQLMTWGVTTEQLRRVRSKYQSGDQQLGAQKKVATSNEASNAQLRESNGEVVQMSDNARSTIEEVLNIEPEENETVVQERREEVFGRNIFNLRNLTFEPNMNIAAPQDYVLGPGDEVVVDIFGATQISIHQFVNSDGVIVIDQYGPLSVGGFTLAQAEKMIHREVGAMYESSAVRVSVGQTRTILLNVMGEVKVPGTYHLSAFSTVFHALYAASGINELGTLRDIKVYRGGREIASVDVYDYILNGTLTGDIRLRDNDVIIVGPYANIVTAEGSVKRPMKYEMKQGETVKQLLRYAGSFAANAYTDAVRIMRSNGKRSTAYNVDAKEAGAFLLQDGDVLTVDKHQERFENIVEVRGAAFRPGIFHIGGGVNTVRQLIEAADGMTENAIGQHALMYRMNDDRTHTLLPVDIDGILAGRVADMPLESEDVLYIPSNEEALKKRTIEVQGEVFSPGVYEYADNETIEDLLLQAGGLLETASLMRVDVARRLHSDEEYSDGEQNRADFFSFKVSKDYEIDHSASFHLEPYDLIFVRRDPAYSEQQNVEVEGEVMYAGLYTLTKPEERVSDLIEKAGGLKKFAYAKGASLQRRLTNDERYRLQLQIDMATLEKDTATVENLRMRLNQTYNVGINLEEAMKHPGSHDDLVLHQGDLLVIPAYNNTVKVSGEVFYPNTITYNDKKPISYYINQAGGYTTESSRRKGYIVYQNGQVCRIRKGAEPEPGCEIIIPAKIHHDYTSRTSTWVAIASSIATLAALVVNIIR